MSRTACIPAVLTLALAPAASAATLTVGPAGQYATISEALNNVSQNGDVIEVEPGDYDETFVVDGTNVEIVGTGGSGQTRIIGSDTNQIQVVGGAELALTGFELVNNSTRAIDVTDASLVATDLRVIGFDTSYFGADGAGIQCTNGTLELYDSLFDSNIAEDGSALRFESCDGLVSNTTFLSGVSTDDGGAIRHDAGTLIIMDSWFEGHQAAGQGGAIHVNDFATVEISGTTFLNNGSDALGGAIKAGENDYGPVDAIVLIDSSTFDGNFCAGRGGAVYHRGNGGLTVRNTTFDGNAGDPDGGAIRFFPDGDGLMTLEDNLFIGNDAGDVGGAVGVSRIGGTSGGGVLATGNDFRANTATRGGGLSVQAVTDVTVVGNTFCGNSTSSSGGALRVTDLGTGASDYTNNVFIENSAGYVGGGIAVFNTGYGTTARFINNTVIGNGAPDGGNVYLDDASAEFQNNIIAFASDGGGMFGGQGPAGVLDYNLWFDNTPDDATGALQAGDFGGGAVTGSDPTFLNYAADGVCGNDLLTLDVGSPAIDAGNPDPAFDDPDGSQNDIGAYGGPDVPPGASTDADGDGWPAIADCDDNDANVNPAASEVCDGVDNDCDGDVDGASAPGATDWYPDRDGDTYGDDAAVVTACYAPTGYIAAGGDCDDGDAAINPDGTETCDGIDENCDGAIDEGLTDTWYDDADGDGFGDGGASTDTCDGAPAGAVANGDDCDDGNAGIYPGAAEICDDLDNNCDGAVDEGLTSTWYRDVDSDGFGDDERAEEDCVQPSGFVPEGGDCDDGDPKVNPGATDSSADGIDQDCDGKDGRKGAEEDLVAISGCACSTGTAPAGGLWLGMVALLAGLRRRK